MTTNSKIDARIYSGINRHNGRYWVRSEPMNMLTNIRLVRRNSIFGNALEVTHRNGHVHKIVQEDRGMFYISGPDYDGECDGFNDGVRLLNNM